MGALSHPSLQRAIQKFIAMFTKIRLHITVIVMLIGYKGQTSTCYTAIISAKCKWDADNIKLLDIILDFQCSCHVLTRASK